MTLTESLLNYLPKVLAEAGYPTRLFKKATTISGGDINEAFRLTSEDESFFIKINKEDPYPDFFEKEARGLELLGAKSGFRVPKVITHGRHEGQIFLILEFISTYSKTPKPENWSEKFAAQLAAMHRVTADNFGLDHDNFIGRLPQSNRQHGKWVDFFIHERLEPQLKKAEKLFSAADRKNFERLFGRLDQLIPEEPPALVHGDLWGGNYMIDREEEPVLVDPATYFGHREMDIAMMQLFGGFDMEIFHLYQQEFPLEGDWQSREDLHNLYPLLVHANIFGGHYPGEVRMNLKKYL